MASTSRTNIHTIHDLPRFDDYDRQRADPPRRRAPTEVTHITLTRAEYDALLAAASPRQAAQIQRTWGQSFRNVGTAVATVAVSAAVAAVVGHLAGRAVNAAINSVVPRTPNVPVPQAPSQPVVGVTESAAALQPPQMHGIHVDVGDPRLCPPNLVNRPEVVQPVIPNMHTGVREARAGLINGADLQRFMAAQQNAPVGIVAAAADGIGPGPLPPPTPPWDTVPPPPIPGGAGPSMGRQLQEAGTAGAFAVTGGILGGFAGNFVIPVVGTVPGEMVGAFVGSLVGAAWNAIF